jgi:hypothetical protein
VFDTCRSQTLLRRIRREPIEKHDLVCRRPIIACGIGLSWLCKRCQGNLRSLAYTHVPASYSNNYHLISLT